jgi:hypothetical protein
LIKSTYVFFAKSPDEIYPGTVNGTDLPVPYDQLESQTAGQLANYMFNLMEFGEAYVDAGAARFKVTTASTFSYLRNPLSTNIKMTNSMKGLLLHISANPAIGRRITLILFSTSTTMNAIQSKLSQTEEED